MYSAPEMVYIVIKLLHGAEKIIEEGNANSLQSSCLENSLDRGAWQATVHRVAKSRTQLSTNKWSLLWWWNVSCLKGIKERYSWRRKTAQDHPRDRIYSVYQLCGVGLASDKSEGRTQRNNIWWDSGSGVGDSLIAQLVKNPPAMQETLIQYLGQEDLL